MTNRNFEGRYVSPEEIQQYVLEKIENAESNPDKYYQMWIDDSIGFCSPDTNVKLHGQQLSFTYEEVLNAIIVIKSGTDTVVCRIKDGKITDERPEAFFLAYKPNKFLVCACCKDGHETFIKIKNGDEEAFKKDITVYLMIHHTYGLFRLYYVADEGKFIEDPIDDSANRGSVAMSTLRFHHIPSNFRTLPKVDDESEDDNE